MKVTNVTSRPRDIAHQDHAGIVAPGATVEVPDHVGESLCQQTDVWAEHVPTKTKTTKTKEG